MRALAIMCFTLAVVPGRDRVRDDERDGHLSTRERADVG